VDHAWTAVYYLLDAIDLNDDLLLLQNLLKRQIPVRGVGTALLSSRDVLLKLRFVQVLHSGSKDWFLIKRRLSTGADETVDLVVAHPAGGVSHANEGSFLEVVRAVVAGLQIIGDLRDFYGHKGLALDLLHALELSMVAAQFGDEAEDRIEIHLIVL